MARMSEDDREDLAEGVALLLLTIAQKDQHAYNVLHDALLCLTPAENKKLEEALNRAIEEWNKI